MKTYEKVYKLVGKIPKGKIATYGQIGQILDINPRVVGWALNKLASWRTRELGKRRFVNSSALRFSGSPAHVAIPWHRVINSKGKISTNRVMNIPVGLQRYLLEKEGVKFNKNEKVKLKKYLCRF